MTQRLVARSVLTDKELWDAIASAPVEGHKRYVTGKAVDDQSAHFATDGTIDFIGCDFTRCHIYIDMECPKNNLGYIRFIDCNLDGCRIHVGGDYQSVVFNMSNLRNCSLTMDALTVSSTFLSTRFQGGLNMDFSTVTDSPNYLRECDLTSLEVLHYEQLETNTVIDCKVEEE